MSQDRDCERGGSGVEGQKIDNSPEKVEGGGGKVWGGDSEGRGFVEHSPAAS